MKLDLSRITKASEPEIVQGDIKTEDMVLSKNYNLMSKDGIYATSFNGAFRVNKKIVDFGEAQVRMNSLGEIKEGIELKVDKIPFKYYMMTLDYFREIHKRYGTEAGVTFFVKNENTDMDFVREKGGEGLIEDGDLLVYCPVQKNTPSVHIVEGEEVYEYLRNNSYPLVEVHSHHTMGIGWSGTDDANMMHFRGYTVFNHIHQFEKTQTRTYIRGEFLDFETSEFFELPWDIYKAFSNDEIISSNSELKAGLVENLNSMVSQIESLDEFPQEWIERGKSERTRYVPRTVGGTSKFGSPRGQAFNKGGKSRYSMYKDNINRSATTLPYLEDEYEEEVDDTLGYYGDSVVDDLPDATEEEFWGSLGEQQLTSDYTDDYRRLGE